MNFSIFVTLLVAYFVHFVKTQSEEEVDYYVNLINERIAQSKLTKGATDASEYRPTSNKINECGTYDFIIVGAGSSGAVVANRLSKKRKYNVLLLEAGGQEDNFTDIPAVNSYLINSTYTWNFQTVPQSNSCLGMINRQCNYARGKGLGGSTIINYLHYVRGNKHDYDRWEKQGNPGWSYKDVLPLFLKSENARFPYTETNYHRKGGELRVEYERPESRQYYAFVDANLEKGRKYLDYNGREQIGVGTTQYNTFGGRRESSNKAFLKPIYSRKNLKIVTRSYAVKVNIKNKKAYGVTFSNNRRLCLARAKREIILSAGVFHTPQLLMLSGVGPPAQLRKHGIPIVQPLSVGENLQDHNGYLALLFKTNVTNPYVDLREQVRQYLRGYGDLTFALTSQALAWFQTKFEKTPDFPDIEVVMITANNTNSNMQDFNNYNDETYNAIWANVDPSRSFTTPLSLMHPKSRGTVTLQSKDPYVFPLIDSKLYSDPKNLDMETMYEGIKIVLDLIKTYAFRRINATLYPTTHPRCQQLENGSKEYWFCQLRYLTMPFYHPVGTCKMGPDRNRGGAVVNHKLKVYGVKNLRVADASIMPNIMTGHSNVPAVMIGEKASQLILTDHQ